MSFPEGFAHIAYLVGEMDGDVGAEIGVHQGGTPLHRLLHVHRHRQGFVAGLDKLDGIPSRAHAGGDYGRDGFPKIASHIPSHRPPRAGVHPFPHSEQAEGGKAASVQLSPGYDRKDAGMGLSLRAVNAQDARMGMGTPQHGHVDGPPGMHIVGKPAPSRDEARVFLALDGGSE